MTPLPSDIQRVQAEPCTDEGQRMRVLDAIDEMEHFTTADVQSATGLPRKHCAAWINILRNEGFVSWTGRLIRNYDKSRPAKVWQMVRL